MHTKMALLILYRGGDDAVWKLRFKKTKSKAIKIDHPEESTEPTPAKLPRARENPLRARPGVLLAPLCRGGEQAPAA